MQNPTYETVVLTALLTVVGTLAVTYFSQWLALKKDQRFRTEDLDRSARYLAIRLVCSLDDFLNECIDVAYDDGLADSSGVLYPTTKDPKIIFPDDADWKSIKPEYMYRSLSFPNTIERNRQHIIFASEISSNPDHEEFFQERIIRYGELGLSAAVLATDIREAYDIPMLNSPYQSLKDTLQSLVDKKKTEKEVAAFKFQSGSLP